MKLELKKIKFGPGSQETTQFVGELYCDGKLVADVSNDGGGGSHMYYPIEGMHKKLEEIKQYAIKQEPKGFEQLDGLVNEMLDDFNIQRQIKKFMTNSIVIGIPGKPESIRTLRYNMPIKKILAIPQHRLTLKVAVMQAKKNLKPGEVIMNDNLEDLI